MAHWFSTYKGYDWTPARGYNETFREQILTLRGWFRLVKDEPGIERGMGAWINYRLQGGDYRITVDSLNWKAYRNLGSYITPHFRLKIQIKNADRKLIFSDTIIIEFSSNYPLNPPTFIVDNEKYKNPPGSPGTHHVYKGGKMCIMGGGYSGYSREQWDPEVDTIITALNRAFDLIAWHYKTFGW